MNELFQILCEIVIDALRDFVYFIKNNLVKFANILNFTLPYFMYYVGFTSNELMNWSLLAPVGIFVLIYTIKSIANRIGKGITVPIPDKRFTEVDDDGEVSIENNRIQEMLLYVADLEDWLERKGLL